MKHFSKYLIGVGCAAAGAALGAAGWKASHRHLDPALVSAAQTEERQAAYAAAKGPIYSADQDWFYALPAKEGVCITSWDGLVLRASILTPPEPTHLWAITVHGHGGCRADMASYARHYAQLGWNVLMPDLRGHGKSDGAAITMGTREKTDLLGWMEFILRRDPQAQIILHGLSMGASTCLMVTGEVTPVHLKAVISDCAFSSFLRQSYHMFAHGPLPAGLMLLSASVATRIWAGFWPCEADAVRQVRRSVTPTLLIHGTEDHFVSPDMLAKLCDACAAPKEWMLVPGAGHGNALYRDPEHYWKRVDDFLSRTIAKEE